MATLRTILLAEDNADDAVLIQNAFREAGIMNPLVTVDSFTAATSFLTGDGPYADRSAFSFPSLLILDWHLSGSAGSKLLRWVSERPEIRSALTAIVFTADEAPATVAEAYKLGAHSFLVKPFDYRQLINIASLIKSYWLETNRRPQP